LLVILQAPVALIQWLAIHHSADGTGLQAAALLLLAMPSSLVYGYAIASLLKSPKPKLASLFGRLWTGIVAATAGAALGVLVQVVGQMTMGLPMDYVLWIVLPFAGIGLSIRSSSTWASSGVRPDTTSRKSSP